MRGWSAGLVGLLVLAGCGGGEEHRAATAKPEATSGGGERAATIIEVEESALRAPARVEIVEMQPVPAPAPLAGASGTAESQRAPSGQAQAELQMEEPSTGEYEPSGEAQAELQMDEPSMGEYEPGAQAQIGIESEEPSMHEPGAQVGIEVPSEDTPIAELELEGDVSRAAAEAASGLCPTDIPGLEVTSSNTRRGSVLTLTTSRPSEVHELRSRVRQLASLLDRERADEACEPGEESAAIPSAEPTSHFVESDSAIHQVHDVRLTDVPDGVRIQFVAHPGDSEVVDALHTQVSDDARSLSEGLCPLSFQTI